MWQPQLAGSLYEEPINISDTADMTLVVEEYESVRPSFDEDSIDDPAVKPLKKVGTFRVEREKVGKASLVFQSMLGRSWAEASMSIVTLQGDNVRAMEIWLRFFHSTLEIMAFASITLKVIWHLVMISDKYVIDRTKLRGWFASWFRSEKPRGQEGLCTDFASRTLFPCFAFDYAEGFQIMTRTLAYSWRDHIHEINPTDENKMHLPSRVIQQLNAAKGRLRTILHRGLFDDIKGIVNWANCDCKKDTVFSFLVELMRIRVWPLEDFMARTSIETILDRLGDFESSRMNVHGTSTGGVSCKCAIKWDKVVRDAVQRVRNYFDGLCLDCMKSSKDVNFRRDDDNDYWNHDEPRERYDTYCRIYHGEPTWYFSFMGRREKRGLIADS